VASDASADAEAPLREQRPKVTRVVSAEVAISTRLAEIWRSRELLGKLIATEIKVKYKNSALGLAWSMVAPAITLAIYWMIFGLVLKNSIPHFVIYLFSGMVMWNFFSTSLQTSTGVIVERAGIVKKVSFPREILVLASVGTAGVYLFFQAIVLVLFMAGLQVAPDWKLLPLLGLALVAEAFLATAFGLILSATNVYMRDTRHLIDIALQVWFFACPIVYSFWLSIRPKLAPHSLSWLYLINPMTPIILTSQRVIYAHPTVQMGDPSGKASQILPTWGWGTYFWMDGALLGAGIVLVYVAMVLFRRLEGNFAEEL
jgi:ABC-2 type transport system permease protein